ncbi:unnamed protein product [Cladocopium goreaui]|uniref:ERAD-associated E3 ubiquitin-protein ligase DOA10 n=1 Tax=Cladocopium goreaui TaxID=2562237 RepID=A0A9P1BLZ8_9DINO|nr:unnamed protein product [Cladocopium goreaui]
MSFGQKLANKAQAARKRHCEPWVKETLNDFMEGCESSAEDGYNIHHKMYADVPNRARDEAVALLEQKLDELGFTNAGAMAYPGKKVEVFAEWNMPAEAPGKSKATPQGIRGKCPICQETRHLVALMPCGHTLCTQCHASSQLRQCPMCRERLTGATRALFMDMSRCGFLHCRLRMLQLKSERCP